MNAQQEKQLLEEILAEIKRNSQIIKDIQTIIRQNKPNSNS